MSGQLNRIIAHIDANSYFASVEQQARPSLRGKPMAVTGPSKRTIIVAASVEAKKLGIKTGTPIFEAKKICPHLILVKADCKRYEAISRNFIDIFGRFTNEIEIFSIDEAFLDLTGVAENFVEAKTIVEQIKKQIAEEIGQNIKCSAGIAQNKFMAKLASEAKKPDGLTIVIPGDEIEFLDQFELSDACGIGPRTKNHLNKLNIFSFKDLRQIDQTTLTLIFNTYGLKLYKMARGIDQSEVVPFYENQTIKSMSRSRTLPQDTFDKEYLKKMGLFFCRKISKQLREHHLLAGSIGLYLRFSDFSGNSWNKKIYFQTALSRNLYLNLEDLFKGCVLKKPVRKIGVWVGNLKIDNNQQFLSGEFRKPLDLELAAEKINKKYARDLVMPATLLKLDFQESPSYGFKKNF